jgi:hypothetical protein
MGVAMSVLAECMEAEDVAKESMKALVSPAPPEVVDGIDFECVLCTRYVLLNSVVMML